MNCALPGFDRSKWTGERLSQIHLGAPPRYDREGKDRDWHRPHEDIEREGCPGAWYRTAFMASILPYRRRPVDTGGWPPASCRARVPNPAFDGCDDPLVHEAIDFLESHEDAAHSDMIRAMTPKA